MAYDMQRTPDPRDARAVVPVAEATPRLLTRYSMPRRHPFWLVVGLLCILGGGYVIRMPNSDWRSLFVKYVPTATTDESVVDTQPTTDAAMDQTAVPAQRGWFDEMRSQARNSMRDHADTLFGDRAQTLTGVIIILLGGAVLGGAFFPCLVTSALVALTVYAGASLTEITLAFPWIALIAITVGYCFHAPAGTGPIPARSVIAVLLVACAGVLLKAGGPPWERLGSAIGPETQRHFNTWADLWTWGVVLLMTAIGVGIGRSRRASFLNAVMLVALAVFCVRDAMKKTTVHTFNNLPGEVATRTVNEVTYDLANVPIWRWLIAAELILLVGILLYQSRGFGLLMITFALAWMIVGARVHDSVGTMSALRSIGDQIQIAAQAAESQSPLTNWGMPVAAGPPKRTRHLSTPPADDSKPAATFQARRAGAAAPMSPAEFELRKKRQLASIERSLTQTQVREAASTGWIIAIALLAGLIAAAGLARLSDHSLYLRLLPHLFWLFFGIVLATLVMQSPREAEQTWSSWILGWTQSRQKSLFLWTLFAGALAVAGSWAFRREANPWTWNTLTVGSVFLGTALSLISIAVLIRLGGFSPLPTWIYMAVAAGQSSLAWLLLIDARQNPSSRRISSVPAPAAMPHTAPVPVRTAAPSRRPVTV